MYRPSISEVTRYIFLPSQLCRADMALIFGTRHPEPLCVAADLYHQGLAPKILVTGGRNRTTGIIESEEMSKGLIALGVLQQDILAECESTNTLENVVSAKRFIEQTLGFDCVREVLFIVKSHHARRGLMTMKRYFPSTVRVWPVSYTYDIDGFTRDNWFLTERGRDKVWGEWERIQTYLAKGDIEELDL